MSFRGLLKSQAILPVHIVWVGLKLSCLPDKSVHIARIGREDSGILDVNEVIRVEPRFCHHRFLWMSKLWYWWCSIILVSIDRPVFPMYT